MSVEERVPNERLRHARSLKGWSQAKLAEEVGTSYEMVSRWERGVTIPTLYFRRHLCEALGMTAEELGLVRDTDDLLTFPTSPFVFLACSYADSEKAVVTRLKTVLQQRGITLLGSRHIGRQGLEQPRKALGEAIRAAQVILLIISPEACSSRHVREALEIGRMYQRHICGVWIDGESWQECLPPNEQELPMAIDARCSDADPARFEEVVKLLQQGWSEPETDVASTPGLSQEEAAGAESSSGETLLMSSSHSSGPSGQAARHNLPVPLTPLIGREQEVAALCSLLRRPEVRLVTLSGTAGIGKTRLALQAIAELLPDFPEGVFFVSLAPLSDPALVLSTIAQVLDIKESGASPLPDLLIADLREKHLLLCLDNFEHLLPAAPRLSDLLTRCPHLSILVTSRAVLHLQGEHVFPVPSLALPDLTQRLPAAETLPESAAVALFLQRAQAATPTFQLTTANARAVAEICIRLEGLPLALELAAARIPLLPPQALLARLTQRLQLLTSGTRDVPARQQTLSDTLAWSYHLLTEEEQRLFRRLAAFVGGCTLQAAEAVCEALGNGADRVVEGVASLLDKCLVYQTEQEGEEEPRFLMLETIREYGRECLASSGETEATRQAHTAYYLALAEQAEAELEGPQQVRWMKQLEQEHDNLRTALRWSLERGEAGQSMELALRLGCALWRFWLVRGHSTEGRTFLERALAGSQQGVVASMRAKALGTAAVLAFDQDDIDRGEVLCQQSLVLYRELGDTAGIAASLYMLGMAAKAAGNFPRARSLIEQAQTLWRQLDDRDNVAGSLVDLAYIVSTQGEYTQGCALFKDGLALFRELGDKRGIVVSLREWAEVMLDFQDDPVTVRSLLEESLTLARELGDKNSIAFCFSLSARVALSQGDAAGARALLEQSVVLFRETGNRWAMSQSLSGLARLEARQGDDAAARALYEESLAIATAGNFQGHIVAGIEGLANVVAVQGERSWAAQLWGAAETLRELMGTPIPPVYRADYDRSVAAARAQLGEKAFAAAWAQGRTMTPEQALAARELAMKPATLQSGALVAPPLTRRAAKSAFGGLTEREREVAALIAEGKTSREIAELLVVTSRTIEKHIENILSKLGFTSRIQIAVWASEKGLGPKEQGQL